MLVFAVVFSLASFSGAISSNFQLPSVHVARATVAPCSTPGSPCSESWVPAGPAMDTFLATIFTDESAEFQNIQGAAPTIDLTDWPLTPDLLSPFTTQSQFYITSFISEHGYFEIQFMLGAGNFWGCNMNFGNSQCGIDIRQGISHLIDKAKFTSTEPTEKGISSPIDNPLPTSNGGLPSPNPCGWDNGVVPAALQPVLGVSLAQTGSNCIVGAPGGTAFHLAPASGGNGVAWLPTQSDLDMCAAAAHFMDAGLATGVVNPSTNPTVRNCSLSGLSPAVTAGGISFFIRSDNIPRLHLGDSLAQGMCALLTGAYTTGCGTDTAHTNIVKVQHGPITAFTGFTTSMDHIDVSWHMYTAAFGNVFPFDNSLYLAYNSRFVSGISSIHTANGGTCSDDSVPTASAGNYMYLCSSSYDAVSTQMEFAPCLTAPGDPTVGSTLTTYGECPGIGSRTADFVVSADGNYTAVSGGTVTYHVFATSIGGFSGTVTLGATANVTATVSLSPSISLTPSGTGQSTLTISGLSSSPFKATVTATSGSLSHQIVLVGTPPGSVNIEVKGEHNAGPGSSPGFLTLASGIAGNISTAWDELGITISGTTGSITGSIDVTPIVTDGVGPAPQANFEALAPPNTAQPPLPTGTSPTSSSEPFCNTPGPCTLPLPIVYNGDSFTTGFDTAPFSLFSNTPITPSGLYRATVMVRNPTTGATLAQFEMNILVPVLDGVSGGLAAEEAFGMGAYTDPIFQQADQFGYLSHTPSNPAATWNRVINHFGNGIANYFTWLNAWNSAPAQPGTIRQGFKQTTRTVSPYIASTVWDFYMVATSMTLCTLLIR